MEKRQLVILGATAAGIALAVQRPDALLLEAGTLLAGEWLASMNIRPDDGRPLGAQAEALREECRALHALGADGRIYTPPMVSVMASHLKAAGTDVRFLSQMIDIAAVHSGFLVSWMDMAGMHAVLAAQLVDTRSFGGRKSICTVLSAESIPPEAPSPHYQVLQGYLPHEWVVKWHLPFEADWPAARSVVHEGIDKLPGCRLAAIAPVFSYDYDEAVFRREADGRISCCSASYPHLFAAWEGGVVCATAL